MVSRLLGRPRSRTHVGIADDLCRVVCSEHLLFMLERLRCGLCPRKFVLELLDMCVAVQHLCIVRTKQHLFHLHRRIRARFAVLMRLGIIPESVCERCNSFWAGAAGAQTGDVGASR